jgi:two-component system chemotaxis response regulator CheB
LKKQDIIVIGASAGGVAALTDLVRSIPAAFKGAVFIVLHIPPGSPSHLPEILADASSLKVSHPIDGEKIRYGHIYVAPPDHHMLIEKERILIKKGPKENRFRPSIDALFRSAAYSWGSRVIGIVLTGILNDGTSGSWSVKRMGGTCIVQDPAEALYPEMPKNVLEYVDVDHIVQISELGTLLAKLTSKTATKKPRISLKEREAMKMEVVISMRHKAFELGIMSLGAPTAFTCPECHGVLMQLKGKLMRYRCHTGHAFTASALLAGISQNAEDSIWESIRILEESTMLLQQMAVHFRELGNTPAARLFTKKAKESMVQSKTLHASIPDQQQLSEDLRFPSPLRKPMATKAVS